LAKLEGRLKEQGEDRNDEVERREREKMIRGTRQDKNSTHAFPRHQRSKEISHQEAKLKET
jgi:hypothetical protein